MDVSGNICAANRNHITLTNAERAAKSQKTTEQSSGVMDNIDNVSGHKTTAAQFHKMPSQTHIAQQHVHGMACEGLPQALHDATLSRHAESLKTLLGIIGKDVAAQDRPTFNEVCQKLVDAKGNPKKESKVADKLNLLLFKYGETSLNKFITAFTEDCREAWRQHHTGFGNNVDDEKIFNKSMMACQEVMEKQIQFLTGANVPWVNIGQYADFFEHTCTAVSKTLINHDGKDDKSKPADEANKPAADGTDGPARPQGPGGTQYSIPGGPGYGPININVAGSTATATANNSPVDNSGWAKAPTNEYDMGVALLKNMPKNEFEAQVFRDYYTRILPQVARVSNSDAQVVSTTTQGTQTDITGDMDFAFQQAGQAAHESSTSTDPFVDGNINGASRDAAEQSVQVSTGLLDELLTPPQTSTNGSATRLDNGEPVDGQTRNISENMYTASRELADALSGLATEMGSPPTSPQAFDSGVFFDDQMQQQPTVGRVPMQTMDGAGIEIEGASQQGFNIDSLLRDLNINNVSMSSSTMTTTNIPGSPFTHETSANERPDADMQTGNVNDASQNQSLHEAGIRGNIASANNLSSQASELTGQQIGANGQESISQNGEIGSEHSASATNITSQMASSAYSSRAATEMEREIRVNGQEQIARDARIITEPVARASIVTSQAAGGVSPSRAITGRETSTEAQEQAALNGNVMGADIAHDATITSPTAGKGVVSNAADAGKRAGGLDQSATQAQALAGNGAQGAANSSATSNNGGVMQNAADAEKRAGGLDQSATQAQVLAGNGAQGAANPSATSNNGGVMQNAADAEKGAGGLDQSATQAQVLAGNGAQGAANPAATSNNGGVMQNAADAEKRAGGLDQSAMQAQALAGNGAQGAANPAATSNNSGVMQNAADAEKRAGGLDQSATQAQAGDSAQDAAIPSQANSNARSATNGAKRANGQPQFAAQRNGVQQPEVDTATVTTPARGKGSVRDTVASFESRAAKQRQANERLVGQSGSGMDNAKVRDNAMGANINYGKDQFQPLKGMKGNNPGYSSHPVYTTSRTIDPFSRLNTPASNFIKQFNNAEVNAKDQRRLSTSSVSEE